MVYGGVIQGSVLGPLLFLLFINDISRVLCDSCCTCKLYADDLKLYTKLDINEDSGVLQSKLHALCEWSDMWQLRISHKKCAVMIVPHHPDNSVCLQIGNEPIPFVNEFKDLGVIIDSNVKFNTHINTIVARASSRANLIHKCFISKDVQTLKRAFITYVRPILEYASCIWSPFHSADILRIEAVQRRFTKRLPGFRHMSYITRCNSLNIETLELRRLRSDLLLTYKILFGLVDIVAADLFTLLNSGYNTRGHMYKLSFHHCRVDSRKHFFSERVVKPWNSLLAQPSDFSTFNSFRRFIINSDFSVFLHTFD